LIHGLNSGGNTEIGHSEGITALAVSPNRRTIAIAERAAVTLYDVAQPSKRRRVLQHTDIGSQEIRFVAFSGDSKQVLTVGGAPSWTMVLWTTDRAAKVTATIKLAPQLVSAMVSSRPMMSSIVMSNLPFCLPFIFNLEF
jgi:WD40 repeat protein